LTDQEVIKEEIDSIIKDILTMYENSGKKVSGEFARGLEARYTPLSAEIWGYKYLAGRPPGKMPVEKVNGKIQAVKSLLEWVKNKGIFSYKNEYEARSIAYAIAKSIAEKGSNKNYTLNIYEKVITPERIDKIIDRISQLNVNRIITEITASFELLEKNV